MTPTVQKLVMSGVAALLVIAASLAMKWDPAISHSLIGAAGMLLGGAWVPTPGQGSGGPPSPPPLAMLCLFGLLALTPACHKPLPPVWPTAVSCAPTVPDVVAQVTQIFFTDTGDANLTPSAEQELVNLAEKYGADTILCIVSKLVEDWANPAASKEAHRTAALRRAKGFLLSTGTVFQ